MSRLSPQEASEQVQALLSSDAGRGLLERIESGELRDNKQIQFAVAATFNDLPSIQGLEPSDQKQVLGRLGGALRKAIPAPPKVLGPGELLAALSKEQRTRWRREQVEAMVTPVAYLAHQAYQALALASDHPRRRDLGWDLVNAGITSLRYAAVVALAEYVDETAAVRLEDQQLNRALVEALQHPADGTWSALLFRPSAGADHSLISVLARRARRRVEALDCLQGELNSKQSQHLSDWIGKNAPAGFPAKGPSGVADLIDVFVRFRNELVHGAYMQQRPDSVTVEALGQFLDLLLAQLAPLLRVPLVVLEDDGDEWWACGSALVNMKTTEAPPNAFAFEADHVGRPLLALPGGPLSLAPWITVADMSTATYRVAGEEPPPEIGLSEVVFFNRFEASVLHYLGFVGRAQLPHHDLEERARAESAYQRFAAHMEGLRAAAAPPSARRQDPVLRFDELAEFHGQNFVGRQQAAQALLDFVAEPTAPLGLVTAKPGMGKSALFTTLYRQFGEVGQQSGWIFHFSARADQRDNAVLGLRSLIAQALEQMGLKKPNEAKIKPPLPWSYSDLKDRFQETLAALGAHYEAKGQRAVILIDAIDEQEPRPGAPPESIYRALPEDLPPGVVGLISVRINDAHEATGVEAGLLAAPRVQKLPELAPLPGLSPADVEQLLREKLGLGAEVDDGVIDRIETAAKRPDDGTLDPFYLRFLADGVREKTIDLSDAGNVPAGLESFFDAIWWDLDPSDDFLLHRVVGMLAEMEGFGSDALFADALHRDEDGVAKRRFGINKLLVRSGAGSGELRYGLFHDRFRWYVQSRFRQADRARALHLPLLHTCERGVDTADHYSARYHSYHLAALCDHPGLSEAERQDHREDFWQRIRASEFHRRNFAALEDEHAVIADFKRAFDVFRPRVTDEPAVKTAKAQRATALALACMEQVAGVANEARARLHDYAREGDTVRVIQLANRAGGTALNWMTLLRAAATMVSVQLDPSPLFEAIEASRAPSLRPSDQEPLAQLLAAAEAPEALRDYVSSCGEADPPPVPAAAAETEAKP